MELRSDGYITINGSRSDLNVGREIKAGALYCFACGDKIVQGLAVIGKADGEAEMSLSIYKWSKRNLQKERIASLPLPHTSDASSHLVCFGRHIFLVHNSVLDYYYLNIEENELERVAIGEDGANETFDWCKFVNPSLVTNGQGYVFWIANNDVYGFPIGYPRQLLHIEGNLRSETVYIRGDDQALYVYFKDKNTNRIDCVRYENKENGLFEGAPYMEQQHKDYRIFNR